MSIYTRATLGEPDNQIVFNDITTDPYIRTSARIPQHFQIEEEDIPVPYQAGISDFLTLVGGSTYVIAGTMYPRSQNSYDSGLAALRAVCDLDLNQADKYATDEGYIPYMWGDALGSLDKQLFVKPLYLMAAETTQQGYVLPFKIVCKIKDPTIFGGALKTASTITSNPTLQSTVTNLITNPSIETGTATWHLDGDSTISQDNTNPYIGTYALKDVVTSGVNGYGGFYGDVIGVSANTTYTYSVWVNVPISSQVQLKLQTQTSGGATVQTLVQTLTGNGSYQRVSITATLGSTEVKVLPSLYAVTRPVTFYADAFQLQTGSTATAYFDGSFSSNSAYTYAWTGVANASSSIENIYVTSSSALPVTLPAIFGAQIYSITANANNIGLLPTYPNAITVYGPITNPTITNAATGESITVNVTLSSSSDILLIQYSKDSFTITKNGVNVANLLTASSTLFKIHPGVNNIQLTGSLSTGAYCTVTYYDGWSLA